MNPAIKRLAFGVMRAAGLNRFAERITRRGLRILCYHGISLADEHLFNPVLFMRPDVFRARLEQLSRRRTPVIPLGEALDGSYPDGAVVITFDDGWAGTELGLDLLHEYRYPATVYVTTYYAQRKTQVFNVLARYLAWKSSREISLDEWGLARGKLSDAAYLSTVLRKGELLDWERRQALADALCDATGHPQARILFRLMSFDTLRSIVNAGFDVQLHTHRHQFQAGDTASILREIRDNRAALRDITARDLQHFCYPSGRYSPRQFDALRDCGVVTATTTERGLNFSGRHQLALARLLDSESLDPVTFEAEISGLVEVLRRPQLFVGGTRKAFQVQTDAIA